MTLAADERAFRRSLTITLGLLGLLTAGSVLLFGHLLFKSLSRDVVRDALLRSRPEAERIAKGMAERSGGDLYSLSVKRKEIDTFVGGALAERQSLSEVEVRDKQGKLVYRFGALLQRPETDAGRTPEGTSLLPKPGEGMPAVRENTTRLSVDDPYSIEIPIDDTFVLRAGVSRQELSVRVDKLRRELYLRTFAAAVVSLLGIAAAAMAVLLLFRRTRRIEAARVEAERRAELGEVAAGLAHEIRNPLNAMSLNLELLEEQLQRQTHGPAPPGVAVTELAQAARQETGRLARLLTDFLSYARPSPITRMPSDLNEPAGEAVTFLAPEAEQRRIKLEFAPQPGGAPCKLDVPRVKQVVLNLIANALDAVESEGATAREVRVAVDEDGPHWRLVVADRGPGVAGPNASDLFKVFVSTKPAGTGLGLPIAERIVRAHGGTLTLSSKAGGVTTAVATFSKR